MAKTLLVLADISGEFSGMTLTLNSEESLPELLDRLQSGGAAAARGEAAPAPGEGGPAGGADHGQQQIRGAAARAAASTPGRPASGTAGSTPAQSQR